MPISANRFATEFVDAATAPRDHGYGGRWTQAMYSLLHDVQRRLDLWCQCQHHDNQPDGGSGERLKVDLLWFPKTILDLAEDEQEWVAPLVAIEHENGYRARDRAIDHWKVSQVAAPLRVFIGYTNSASQMSSAAEMLQRRESRWNVIQNGEALIVLGHSNMKFECFRLWSAKQGSKEPWSEFGASRCRC